ncbi:HlyD family secretion protein [Chloroflexota bacterium]
MKSWRIVIVLLLFLVLVGSISCNPVDANEQEAFQQPVEQDDLTATVSGSGNIEVSNELKLTFGVTGKVDKIYVEEGDEVSEGEVLAKLEIDALELALNEARLVLNQAQVGYNQAHVAVTQAQASVTQAEIALQTAEYELGQTEETYTLSDIKTAQADVEVARRDREEAIWTLYKYELGTRDWEEYQKIVNQSQLRLNAAEDKLDAILFGNDTKEVAIKRLRVEATQQSLEAARQSFGLAEQSVELDRQSLEIAKQSLKLTQKQLDEATIIAPFDGLVASVDVDEGDTVSTAIIIVHLIDPNSMELNIEVDEIDIPEVKLGQRAIIEIDALPDLPLEGKVSSISLLPTIETGLIMYDVKIEFDVPDGTVLRAGMSATADIVIAE